MIVKCITNDGYLFSPRKVREGHDMITYYDEVTANNQYIVYGILLYEDGLRYLLCDDVQMAYWYPAELFEVIESKTPNTWEYQFYGYVEGGVSAIFGYHELVHCDGHFDDLGEQDGLAMDLFYKRKLEIDSQSL